MAQADNSKMHADTVEYYRMMLELHRSDPHAHELVRAEEIQFEVVRNTPDPLELNAKITEGGHAFAVARAMTVDNANHEAEIADELEFPALAELCRKAAGSLLAAKDWAELDEVQRRIEGEKAAVRVADSRMQFLFTTAINYLMEINATPQGSGLDTDDIRTLAAHLNEIKSISPEQSFVAMMELPRFYKRLYYDPEKRKKIIGIFARINREKLGGGY